MKKIIIAITLLLCIAAAIFMILTTNGRATRKKELSQSLAEAVESSLDEAFLKHTYSINNAEEFVADFLQYILVKTNSNSNVTVNVLDIDYEKGMVALEITGRFKHPNGADGVVSVQKTVLLEQPEELPEGYYRVTYYVKNKVYMEMVMKEGEMLQEPDSGYIEGFRFWGTEEGTEIPIRNAEGNLISVKSDLNLYAVLE